MNFAMNATQIKSIDDYTINHVQIPALVLMERAALKVVEIMKQYIKKEDRILVVCGPGNNGGDGIAAGRILKTEGYHVALLFIGNQQNATEQTKLQLKIANNLSISMENNNKLHEYNIIIDSIFGVGLSRPVTGEYENIIHSINQCEAMVFSVDIPSGISANNGAIMNVAVKADYTITFGYQKIGLLLYPGANYSGYITVVDIGFPSIATKQVNPNTFYYQADELKRIPKRRDYSNKGTYGKVLVIAGTKGMSGAAYLAAKAAYKCGVGLVKILTASENRVILQTLLPEALFAAYDDEDDTTTQWLEKVKKELKWASVIVIGPGMGVSPLSEKLLEIVEEYATVPVIIDADGINILSEYLDRRQLQHTEERLQELQCRLKEGTILTPHIKELARLLQKSPKDIVDNIIDSAVQCSYNNKLIYAIKDARSIVTQGEQLYINTSGNHGMATGGSGDVLTGIIAGFIAQGMEQFEATCLAVYIHGLAGDSAAGRKGTYSLMASDIVDSIEMVLKE